MAGHLLDPDAGQEPEVQEGAPQVPSIVSLTNNYVINAADVSAPSAEDGSRLVKLIAANGGVVIDAALSAELCAYLAEALVAIEVIEQEEGEDAAPGEPG